MNWTGKVAIVTGGASGIGKATVEEFAKMGVRVAIFDINESAGAESARAFTAEGWTVTFHKVDVSDAEAVKAGVAAVAAAWGQIDFLMNNAVSFIAKGLSATTAEWERSLGVNVRGYANMVAACYPYMKGHSGCAIVNIASISAHIAQPDRWTYNATKGAIVSLTRCQALDLSPDGIRVNCINPGWIWTPEVAKAANGDRVQWEPIWGRYAMLRRLGEPREIARVVLFLCSDDASFITAAQLNVDGGYGGIGSEGLGGTSTFAGSE